eukprot:TRINITY_DN3380_c0_g1_i1.p1 TRINITY_DN3380_c0_g1~~TRINITY_DN3380_c0_g1_i1.p1  ORF type:complete len:121 (-),score=40.89 TRINITY_DN3380_c0_g1_i1:121-462(-)
MFAQVFTLLVLSALAQASEQPKDVLCDICVDVVTDLDNWLVDDATEADIVAFVEQLCTALGFILEDLETMCKDLIESELPGIIDGLVEQNLNPSEVCASIGACSAQKKFIRLL